MKVGDKVKPSKDCRRLYGDPEVMTITDRNYAQYKVNLYSIWFNENELELIKTESTMQSNISYCVHHNCKRFIIEPYQFFQASKDTSVVHFIGTLQECEEFVRRSIAVQELIDSANREHV